MITASQTHLFSDRLAQGALRNLQSSLRHAESTKATALYFYGKTGKRIYHDQYLAACKASDQIRGDLDNFQRGDD